MTYQVTDEELRTYHGTTLKIFIVLNNSPNGYTAKQLAAMVNEPLSSIYRVRDLFLKMGKISQNGNIIFSNRENFLKMRIEKERTKEKENISSKNLKEEEEGARTRENIRGQNSPPKVGGVPEGGGSMKPRQSPEGGGSMKPRQSPEGGGSMYAGQSPEEKEVDFISSLLDNPAQLEALLMTCHLPPQADLQAYFHPFAERFKTDLEASGEDLYLLDRKSAKYRFKCWFTKHYKEIDNGKWKIDNDVRTTISCPLDTPRDVSKDTVNWDELLEIAKRKRAEREAARAK